jgi:hypothetical protein
MTIHPTLLSRSTRVQRLHRSVLPAGEITARRQIEALDPCGLLSLGLEVGEERAREVLERVHNQREEE